MSPYLAFIVLAAVVFLGVAMIALGFELAGLRREVRELNCELERRTGFLEPRCRECRCTDEVACLTGCWWVEDDLCSSCADDAATHSSFEVYLPDGSPERHRGLVDEVLNRLRRGREA